MLWQFGVRALEEPLEESLHIVGHERWPERRHFVDDAAEGPDITLVIIRLIFPHLRRGIIRRPRLRVIKPLGIGHL